jgi:hypothetical protein
LNCLWLGSFWPDYACLARILRFNYSGKSKPHEDDQVYGKSTSNGANLLRIETIQREKEARVFHYNKQIKTYENIK